MSNLQLEKIKIFIDKYWQLMLERIKSILLVIQFFLALLVIASFTENIIPENKIFILKNLIIFILLLIPVMLWDYILQINEGLKTLGTELNFSPIKKTGYKNIIDGSNYLYILILSFLIDFFIYLIIQNIIYTIIIITVQLLLIILIAKGTTKKEKK